jgi:hypothetical protein
MTPYKEDIFREVQKALAEAKPEQIERLLHDIANGAFCETAQTRAGTNDNHCNVTGINELVHQRRQDAVKRHNSSGQLSAGARAGRRAGYSA